jgi:hypothetical protein
MLMVFMTAICAAGAWSVATAKTAPPTVAEDEAGLVYDQSYVSMECQRQPFIQELGSLWVVSCPRAAR